MQIIDVEQFLAQHDVANPLRPLSIAVLDPRREPYQALLCQPHGTIHASHNRICNSDSAASAQMYLALLQEAIDRQSQLVVTPEYSVPWGVIGDIARGPLRPPMGSLWALGSESITPDELEALRASLANQNDVRLLHEALDPQQRVQRSFIDPLVYLFWARTQADATVLCVLVQFKTVPCRDDDHVELRSLYLGRNVYRFRNRQPSVQLIGIICSDAFDFNDALVDANCADVLLLHVQLNKNPANPVYSAYRSRFYAVAGNNNAEVVCLNWSAGVRIEGMAGPWNEIAGSGWYVSPKSNPVDDADVNRLHHDGVYYSLVEKRWHGFYLNYSAHFIVIEKQRVFSTGPQVLAPRLAPHVIARCAWNEQTKVWATSTADDGFGAFLQGYQPLDATLPTMCRQDPLAVERAMELLEGTDGSPSDWYALKQLRALRVADEESLRRVTVSQETDRFRAGVGFRRERARKAMIAVGIPGQPMRWPGGATDLANGFRYRWAAAEPHCNVEPLNGTSGPATFVFLGDEPDQDALSSVYAKLSKALRADAAQKRVAGTSNVDPSQAADRLCVVYRRNNVLQSHRPSASISDPADGNEDDIARGDQ
jgi:predicted amidohydrolase